MGDSGVVFFFSSRRRHTRYWRDWSSDVCSSDLDVPIVVAVNKVDKEGADPAKVRGQLTEYGLVAEEYGGETMFVDVSAKTGRSEERRVGKECRSRWSPYH